MAMAMRQARAEFAAKQYIKSLKSYMESEGSVNTIVGEVV